jgi:hypothetical protein
MSGDQPTAAVRGRDGAFHTRVLHTGLVSSQYVEVRSGVRPGDRVLVPNPTDGG